MTGYMTPEQLATIEVGETAYWVASGWGREITISQGTVTRLTPTQIVVTATRPGGDTYGVRFRKRDGMMIGVSSWIRLIDSSSREGRALISRGRITAEKGAVATAFHAWNRDRDNVEALRELHRRARLLLALLEES